jgi:anti-sigma factor RsiW
MDSTEKQPTHDELLAMAYADGELSPAERSAFERTLAEREDLRLEVVRARRLAALARHAAGPEPMDTEWAALASEPVFRAVHHAGWWLASAGLTGLAGFGVYALWDCDAHPFLKWMLTLAALGAVLLLFNAVRARLRTRAFDPYTEIQR